ncbi:MAG: hypothetical protein MR215_04645 [Bacteroidales bacterium]|nr:hypothetical protein [Bacteroidales bacterium]MDD7725758.1 proton-conducting transporter membrane subunit [Bacteroidales bacterium]
MNTIILSYLILSLLLSGLHLINKNSLVCRILVATFLLAQVAMTAYIALFPGHIDDAYFRADGLATLLCIVTTIVAAASLSHSRRYIIGKEITDDNTVRSQYYGAMTALTMAVTLASLSSHLAVTWIFVEITTLSASALIFYRRTKNCIEATWKYVFVCSVSLVFVYVGILLTSISMGREVEAGLSFATLKDLAASLDPFWLQIAFIFIFVGYTAKMGLAPMFTAGIDAKDAAPTPASAMLSSIVMNAGFVGFFRFYAVVAHTSIYHWAQMVVVTTGVLSIFIATVYLVKVHNIKRLFAYSSVEHIGVIMLGVAAGGVGVYAAILHLVLHSFAKAAIFMHVGELFRIFGTKELANMGRYINKSGTGAVIVILGLLCITAMPPSGMFMTELMVIKSLIDVKWWVVIAIALILLCTIVWAISKDLLSMLFLPAEGRYLVKEPSHYFPAYESVWQFILLGLSIWWGLWTPQCISELIKASAAILN